MTTKFEQEEEKFRKLSNIVNQNRVIKEAETGKDYRLLATKQFGNVSVNLIEDQDGKLLMTDRELTEVRIGSLFKLRMDTDWKKADVIKTNNRVEYYLTTKWYLRTILLGEMGECSRAYNLCSPSMRSPSMRPPSRCFEPRGLAKPPHLPQRWY